MVKLDIQQLSKFRTNYLGEKGIEILTEVNFRIKYFGVDYENIIKFC